MIENAAVFISGRRMFKNVNVEVEADSVVVRNRANGAEMARYSVVEVAKANEAFDIVDTVSQEPDQRLRLVVQQGCGCSGMRPYKADESYSGFLRS